MKINIQSDVSLKHYNTFGIDVPAKHFVEVADPTDLVQIYELGLFQEDFFILGGGSNVLFTEPYQGYIFKISSKGISYHIDGDQVLVTAQAGEIWNDLVWFCINNGFAGLENMALIPGTVGASPVQNIGAYGTELMYVFYSCRAFDTYSGQFVTFQKEDCNFSYRDSIFKTTYKGRYIITEVTYALSLTPRINIVYGAIATELELQGIKNPSIADVAKVVSKIRVQKLPDPSTVGNAGSFFKNPIVSNEQFKILQSKYPEIPHYTMETGEIKLAAGWLIGHSGWKGKAVGDAGVWKNQALVLINRQHASGKDIFNLSAQIMDDVYHHFDVRLEREVNIL